MRKAIDSHLTSVTRRFGLPAETSMVVFDSKPETISISCRPDDDHGDSLSKDFLHGRQPLTGGCMSSNRSCL